MLRLSVRTDVILTKAIDPAFTSETQQHFETAMSFSFIQLLTSHEMTLARPYFT